MASVINAPSTRNESWKRIYVPAGIVATLIALTGFWPTYFGPFLAGTLDSPAIIHLHAATFVGWLLIVIAQGTLAATGHKALHIKLGQFGILYGVFLIFVGIATSFIMFGNRIEAGQIQEAQTKLFVPLTDMVVFAPFLLAAWIYRRKPEIHKRLIIVATTILLIAAVHRMTHILGPRPILPAKIFLVWLAPIYIAMIFDFAKARVVHPVYLIGIAAIVYLKLGRMPLLHSQSWKDFAGWVTGFYV
jgi:hypothetical protein